MFHAQEIDLEGHGGFEMDVRTDGRTDGQLQTEAIFWFFTSFSPSGPERPEAKRLEGHWWTAESNRFDRNYSSSNMAAQVNNSEAIHDFFQSTHLSHFTIRGETDISVE